MSTNNALCLNIKRLLESLAECHASIHHSQTVLHKLQLRFFMCFFSETSSTLLYYSSTSLYLTLHYYTIALLHSTWLYITLSSWMWIIWDMVGRARWLWISNLKALATIHWLLIKYIGLSKMTYKIIIYTFHLQVCNNIHKKTCCSLLSM